MIKNQLPKILMVSTEYHPMRGGVGRYTFNLVRQLRKKGLNVLVACKTVGERRVAGARRDHHVMDFLGLTQGDDRLGNGDLGVFHN